MGRGIKGGGTGSGQVDGEEGRKRGGGWEQGTGMKGGEGEGGGAGTGRGRFK